MAKETAFSFPPRGHAAGLLYDAAGDQWIAQPCTLWSYDDRWAEDLGGTKSGAGTYAKDSTVVPAGEVWVVEYVYLVNETGARGSIFLYGIAGSIQARLQYIAAPAQWELVSWTGHLTLKEGDKVTVQQISCADGDVLRSAVWGHKMKVLV